MESILVPGLLVALLLSSCGATTPPLANATAAPPASDCGVFAADGQSCFEEAMASCSGSSVLLFDKVPPVSAHIQGKAAGTACTVVISGLPKSEIDRIMLSNSASQWEVDQMNSKMDSVPGFGTLVGQSATCVVERTKADEFASGYVYQCSGPLIDSIKGMKLAEKFA